MSWIVFEHDGKPHRLAVVRTSVGVWVGWPGRAKFFVPERAAAVGARPLHDELRAPMTGRVLKVKVAAGACVRANQVLLILEAMKMEYQMQAPFDGTVAGVFCKEGDLVDLGQPLVKLAPADGGGSRT